jgi:thiamine kinase-like enzyme
MAKKKTEEKPVVTVTTATEVAEKPKRTRKKSATVTRSTESVISEITERKDTVAKTANAVSTILSDKKPKKTSAIKRINDAIVDQSIQKQVYSDLMIRNRYIFGKMFAIYVDAKDTHFKSDPLNVAACEDFAFRHLK